MVHEKTSKPKPSAADVEKRARALVDHQEQVDKAVKCARYSRRFTRATLACILASLPISIAMLVLSLTHRPTESLSLWGFYTAAIAAGLWCAYRSEINFKDMRHYWDQATITTLMHCTVLELDDVHNMLDAEYKIVEAFRGKA